MLALVKSNVLEDNRTYQAPSTHDGCMLTAMQEQSHRVTTLTTLLTLVSLGASMTAAWLQRRTNLVFQTSGV